jgi:hypothetical protein
MSTGSLLRGIREFMFIIYCKHSELIVLRAGYYDDVEADWGTRFRSHHGQGASVYNVSLSHPLANAP